MQEKWNASSSGVGEALLVWLSLIQGPRGPGGGLMGPPHPPHLTAQVSLGAAWVSPQGRGMVACPQRAWGG